MKRDFLLHEYTVLVAWDHGTQTEKIFGSKLFTR